MAVTFMMIIKELRRNGGETAATAICRRIFLPFLAELDILESFEAILFFSKTITQTFLHLTLFFQNFFDSILTKFENR